MRRTWVVILLLATLAFAKNTHQQHRDYVPDQKTAERIAEAILVAQYGQESVDAQKPLLVNGSNKDYWVVQGSERTAGIPRKGGGFAVWINRHSGCLQVMEHMK